MTIEADLFTALGALVGNRMKPLEFGQDGVLPTWPAIRYVFISDVPAITSCGNSETAGDVRVQLDVADSTFLGMRALRLSIIAAMRTFTPPAVLQDSGEEKDPGAKVFRARLDYIIHQSSP